MRTKLLVALLFSAAALPAFADTPLVIDSGWQNDQVDAVDTPSVNSAWTFNIASPDGANFALSDCCVVGDTYKLYDASATLIATSSFYAGNATDRQATGAYGPYWTDANYGKLLKWLPTGNYALTVTGDGAGGLSAGFGVRLDAVPEPATWALMIAGFGMVGAAMRRRAVAHVAA